MNDKQETNHAFARSRSNAGLGLINRINEHLRQLSPHMMQRDGVVLLKDAREEIYRLREAILVQLCETEDSEYMTGAQRDQFARDALSPNVELSGLRGFSRRSARTKGYASFSERLNFTQHLSW